MLVIDSISVEIEATNKIDGKKKKCGFFVPLKQGLNIITGNNTSGKSTILSCIYYCLGLEELLGNKNEKALDNSLKTQFELDGKEYHINYSAAQISIQNSNGLKVTLLRKITGDSTDSETQKIFISQGDKKYVKFVHSRGDTIRENGFFNWLEGFIGLTLPNVATFDDKETKLYFQNIFSGIFIEQKKGWSDYFSTSPTFSIKDVKQKIFEFFLDLGSLRNEFESDQIKSQIRELKKQWDIEREKFLNKIAQYDAFAEGIPIGKIITRTELENDLIIYFQTDDRQSIKNEKYISEITKKISSIDNRNLTNDDKKSSQNFEKIDLLKNDISVIEKNIDQILITLNSENEKIKLFNDKIKNINKAVQNLEDLRKVKDENIFSPESIDRCPLCQSFILNANDNITQGLDDNTIQNSIGFHKNQLALYKSYVKTAKAIHEKLITYHDYYEKVLKSNKFKLQMAYEDCYSDSRAPSKLEITESVLLKQQLDNAKYVEKFKQSYISSISEYSKVHENLKSKLIGIQKNIEEDQIKISKFKTTFQNYLTKFEYKSQNIKMIDIDNTEPQKLLPSISVEGQKESLRTTSSASDFVRVLWAYYLSFMAVGKNHPGILIFDEPGQHAMMLNSLKALVETCVNFKKIQIILAVSKDKPGHEKINLDDILRNIEKKNINVYSISDEGKCVHELLPKQLILF